MRLLIFNLATDLDDAVLGFTSHWIRALAQRVDFIHVITMRTGRVEMPQNVRVESIGKEKGYGKPRRVKEFYSVLWRVLRDEQIDICFSHMLPLFTVLGAPLLKARRIPIVTWYAHPTVTWTLRACHLVSDQMVSSIATAYPYKRDKLTAIGQGIATDIFSPIDDDLRAEPPIILCVGRLSPVKNHPTLVSAAALLRQFRSQPFRIVIVGGPATANDDRYVRSLDTQIKRLGLSDLVTIEPAVPMHQLPAWYRRCTVHVNMSPTGFGDKVAWEAMSCGKPCLVANEGFRETLGDYSAALIYRYGDVNNLAERLHWILGLSQRERNQIGDYLRKQVVSMHGISRLAHRLVGLFESLIRTRRPHAVGSVAEIR